MSKPKVQNKDDAKNSYLASGWLRAEGAAVFLAASTAYLIQDYSLIWYLVLLFTPDIFMIGYVVDQQAGRVSYNIGHSYPLPLSMGLAGLALSSDWLIAGSLIWLAHIGLDRTLGYGLKVGSFRQTHLGALKAKK